MSIVGNNLLRDIYYNFGNINTALCEVLECLKYSNEKFIEGVDIDLLDKDEHFFITCCSAIIIWSYKKDNDVNIPKWLYDERLTLEDLYVFGRQYKDRGYRFVHLYLNAPNEFLVKNVLFDEDGLYRC